MTGKRPSSRRAMRNQATTCHLVLPLFLGGSWTKPGDVISEHIKDKKATENTQCGLIEDKLGLTNLNAFGDDVTKERTKDE